MSLNYFQPHSIKTRVTLFSLVIFVLSIWTLSFYASRMLFEDMQRQMGEQQLTTASYIAAEINGELEERVDALNLVARFRPKEKCEKVRG